MITIRPARRPAAGRTLSAEPVYSGFVGETPVGGASGETPVGGASGEAPVGVPG
ncbi:hypothetical protein BDV10DRAFT_172238 [Aspergillus recurvatus]